MSPIVTTLYGSLIDRRAERLSPGPFDLDDLRRLEEGSQLPEAQGVIREGIRRGLIRVLPASGSGSLVRLVRIGPEWLSTRLEG